VTRTPEQQERLDKLHMAMEYIVEMRLQEAYFTALEQDDQEAIEDIKDYLWTKNS
jgi:hypothetical protein